MHGPMAGTKCTMFGPLCNGINPLEQVISARRDKFLKRYYTSDKLCQLIQYDKHWMNFICVCVSLSLFVHSL